MRSGDLIWIANYIWGIADDPSRCAWKSAVSCWRLARAHRSPMKAVRSGRDAVGAPSGARESPLACAQPVPPRVLLPESPFGFVVIDDSVQAMAPGKVDGLARVLATVA